MATKYWVENNCGGTIYCGTSKSKAEKAAIGDHFATPYIHTEDGAYPVVEYTLDGETESSIGKLGESWNDFRDRLTEDLAGYGDRAFVG